MSVARIALLILSLPLLAAAPQPKTYPAPSFGFPGGVTMREQVYRTLPGFRPLTLDLYLPKAGGYPRPALLFVHGGSWLSGDSRHAGTFGDFPGVLALLAARGYVVASVNYRLSGEARFPAALMDVKSAIGWLRLHAQDFNIDTTRIAVWGASAGGHLALMAGLTCGVASLEPAPPAEAGPKPPSTCVEAVIDWYGVSDFDSLPAGPAKQAADLAAAVEAFLGCAPKSCAPGVTRAASPISYIAPLNPPILIQHGGADSLVPVSQSQALYDALHAAGVPAELAIYPQVGHSFARDGAADAAVNRQAIEKIEAFLDAHFPKKPLASPPRPKKRQGLPY